MILRLGLIGDRSIPLGQRRDVVAVCRGSPLLSPSPPTARGDMLLYGLTKQRAKGEWVLLWLIA